jgi:hypothetical protein
LGDDNLVLKNQSTGKIGKSIRKIECLDGEADDEGFIEGDIDTGKVFSTFNFGMSAASNANGALVSQPPVQKKAYEMLKGENQPYASAPRGLTPPVNGEPFTIKRSYAMRPSTVRKLNALKAEHPDVNVLFNTIVDMAFSNYYNYMFSENGSFGVQQEKKLNSSASIISWTQPEIRS